MRTNGARLAAGVLLFVILGCSSLGATGTIAPSISATAPPSNAPESQPVPSISPASPDASYPFPVSGEFVGTFRSAINCPAIKPDGASPWPYGKTDLYELGLPMGWSAKADPYRIIRPDGSVAAEEGDLIRVTGEIPGESGPYCSFGRILNFTDVEVIAAHT